MGKLLKKTEFIEAVIWLIVAVFVIIYGAGLHSGENLALSPALFPVITGGFMLALSITLMMNSRKSENTTQPEVQWLKIIFVVALTIIYIALMPLVGFMAATMLYLCLMIYLLGEKDLLKLGAVAVGTTGFIYYIFDVLLNVRLP